MSSPASWDGDFSFFLDFSFWIFAIRSSNPFLIAWASCRFASSVFKRCRLAESFSAVMETDTLLSLTSWDISSMASRDGNGDPGVGSSCSDPRRELYAFSALRT